MECSGQDWQHRSAVLCSHDRKVQEVRPPPPPCLACRLIMRCKFDCAAVAVRCPDCLGTNGETCVCFVVFFCWAVFFRLIAVVSLWPARKWPHHEFRVLGFFDLRDVDLRCRCGATWNASEYRVVHAANPQFHIQIYDLEHLRTQELRRILDEWVREELPGGGTRLNEIRRAEETVLHIVNLPNSWCSSVCSLR